MSDLDDNLQWAAERACGTKAQWEGFVRVVETIQGQIVWERVVTIFESDNGRIYAWPVQGDQEPQYVAVLHNPPVDSPHAAVREWLKTEARKQ